MPWHRPTAGRSRASASASWRLRTKRCGRRINTPCSIPSEVELGETTRSILEEVDRINPRRVVFDSLSELRLLAGSPLRYRRQILALKQFFAGRNCTGAAAR